MKKIIIIILLLIRSISAYAIEQQVVKPFMRYQNVKWEVNYLCPLYTNKANSIYQSYKQMLELLKRMKAQQDIVERYQEWDYYIPQDVETYNALGKNALFMIIGFTHKKDELPITLVVNNRRYSAMISIDYADQRIKQEVAKLFGQYKILALYLVPIFELRQEGRVAIDWGSGRKDSLLVSLPIKTKLAKEILEDKNAKNTTMSNDADLLNQLHLEYCFSLPNDSAASIYKKACKEKNSRACNKLRQVSH